METSSISSSSSSKPPGFGPKNLQENALNETKTAVVFKDIRLCNTKDCSCTGQFLFFRISLFKYTNSQSSKQLELIQKQRNNREKLLETFSISDQCDYLPLTDYLTLKTSEELPNIPEISEASLQELGYIKTGMDGTTKYIYSPNYQRLVEKMNTIFQKEHPSSSQESREEEKKN